MIKRKEERSIINYGKSEEIIKKIEAIFKEYDLALSEIDLIITFIKRRIQTVQQRDDANKLMSNMPLNFLFNKFKNKITEEKGGE